MADTTPLSNQINVNIARRLDDALAGADNGIKAATDGIIWTAALRNQYVNNSIRAIAQELFNRFGVAWIDLFAPSLKTTQAITFSNAGVTLNKDYMYPVRLYDSSGEYKYYPSKADLDEDKDPYVDRAFIIEGNKLYGYKRATGVLTILNSGSGTLYYINAQRKDTNGADVAVNTAPDTTLEQSYHEAVEYYACGLAWFDKGVVTKDQDMVAKGLDYQALALTKLPQGQKAA